MDAFQQQNRTVPQTQQQPNPALDPGAKRDDLRGMSYAQGQDALRPEQAPGGGSVERHEAPDARLGATKQPVQVSVAPQKGEEGKPVRIKVDAKDPEKPGRLDHLWFTWKQTSGPAWLQTSGMYQPELEFMAPYVKGDQQVVGEVTVTKRGYLNVQGLSTTQRFSVGVRDTGAEQPAPKQAQRVADPTQQPEPGTLPPATLLLTWLALMQQSRTPAPAAVQKPQPPQVKAPGETKVTPGDRATLRASVTSGAGSTGGIRTVWTQDSGPPIQDTQGQSTPELSFKAPQVSARQTVVGRVTAVDKAGLKAEDRFCVVVEPRIAANETGKVWGDPHFIGGDGDTFDVMGRDGGIYQIVSDAGIQLNAKFKKWAGTNITVVDNCGGVVTFKDAAGQTKRSEVYFESGIAKLDGRALPRNKSVKLADGGSALFLANGDLIVDTREGYKVTFHSMGAGNRRYVNFEVQTGARGVGDGGAAGGLLGQTFDADKTAKHGRKGDGAQGEGAIAGVVTDYEVAGGVFGNPKPGKAAPQPASAASGRPLERTTVLVSANPTDLGLGGFVDAGVDVSLGDEILIKASGKAAEAGRSLTRTPDGDARYRHPRKNEFLCGAAPAFALVGRVAGAPSFMVGSSHSSRANASGRLMLGFNDLAGTFRDNSGEYLADVQVLKGITQAAPKPAARTNTPSTLQQIQDQRLAHGQAQAQQNLQSLLALLPPGAASQAAQQPQPTRTQTTASLTNTAAASALSLALARQAALRNFQTRSRMLATLPSSKTGPPLTPNVERPLWLPQQKVLARPTVSTPDEKNLQSGERGRMTSRIVDPDQGKFGPPRVEWRQETGPKLEKVTGQGTATMEFTAPQATQRSVVTGRVMAVDADGMRGESRFRVNIEPRIAAGEKGKVHGDPHFVGGDGGKFDIQGRNGGVYNILSDAGLRVTALFKRYHRDDITVMDKCGATLVGKSGGETKTSAVEFRPNGAFLNGKALTKGKSVDLADGGSALYLGDRLIVDTREGYKLTFFARQSGSVKFVDLDVETGARGVGSDGDSGGLLGQTFDADKKARDGKKGAGAQGEGAIAGKVTDYELSGGIFGKTKDGKAAPDAAKSERRLVRRTVLVKANPGTGALGYVDSGLSVEKGDSVLVRGSGAASEHGSRLTRKPEGDAGYRHSRKADFMAAGAPAFALVGRMAGERQGFMVGSSFSGKMAKTGKLELAFNDLAGTFGDNQGEYLADVQVVKEFA